MLSPVPPAPAAMSDSESPTLSSSESSESRSSPPYGSASGTTPGLLEVLPAHPAVLHFGTASPRRVEVLDRLRAAGARVADIDDVVGDELYAFIANASVVIAPALYPGRAFACFMRVVQCVSMGVVIVAEAGDAPARARLPIAAPTNSQWHRSNSSRWRDGNDDIGDSELESDALEALVTRLGGVHLVKYENLVTTTVSLLRQGAGMWRLTPSQQQRWRDFGVALQGWDGTAAGIRQLWSFAAATTAY